MMDLWNGRGSFSVKQINILFYGARTSARPMLFSSGCFPPLCAGLSEQLDAGPSRAEPLRLHSPHVFGGRQLAASCCARLPIIPG